MKQAPKPEQPKVLLIFNVDKFSTVFSLTVRTNVPWNDQFNTRKELNYEMLNMLHAHIQLRNANVLRPENEVRRKDDDGFVTDFHIEISSLLLFFSNR